MNPNKAAEDLLKLSEALSAYSMKRLKSCALDHKEVFAPIVAAATAVGAGVCFAGFAAIYSVLLRGGSNN